MAWKVNHLVDSAIDIVVYQSATHGEHAGKLSVLLTTRHYEVYGMGMNTLVTNSLFNRDHPMQEGSSVFFSNWIKVEKLCELGVQKIAVGFGWGAAVTRHHELFMWGAGATTYLPDRGIEIVELYNPGEICRCCNQQCADYGRRIGDTLFSYCKEEQKLVTYLSPPPNVPVKRLGNRRYGALTCSACSEDCDLVVMENYSFNFCNNCNHLWDLDENMRPMNTKGVSVGSFFRRLEYPKIRDVAPGPWGFWVLIDSRQLVFSGFFIHPEPLGLPIWWKQPLSLPFMKPPHHFTSTHSNKTDVFVITDAGVLYKRVQAPAKNIENNVRTHNLTRIPLATGVKKMCCGRLASLCLLDEGTVWIIYSQENGHNPSKDSIAEQTDAEELLGKKGANECLDVSGILYADLFYVQTSQMQGHMTKKHPLVGNLIEIIYGVMDCKTFLCHFFDRCRVWSEGNISYDALAATQLINNDVNSLWARESYLHDQKHARAESIEFQDQEHLAGTAGQAGTAQGTLTSAGLGFPVGMTSWLSRASRLVQKAAAGWQSFAGVANRTYQGILTRIALKLPEVAGTPSSTDTLVHAPTVRLPPFQSSLYGKRLFSDLTLHLRDGYIPAHRIVLCSTSKHFEDKLANGNTKSLDMKMYNPRAYRCLLKHLYQIDPGELMIKDRLDLLILAKIYKEPRLIEEVEEHIIAGIDSDNASMIMEVAMKYGFTNVQMKCELFMNMSDAQEKQATNDDTTGATTSLTYPFQNNLQQE